MGTCLKDSSSIGESLMGVMDIVTVSTRPYPLQRTCTVILFPFPRNEHVTQFYPRKFIRKTTGGLLGKERMTMKISLTSLNAVSPCATARSCCHPAAARRLNQHRGRKNLSLQCDNEVIEPLNNQSPRLTIPIFQLHEVINVHII